MQFEWNLTGLITGWRGVTYDHWSLMLACLFRKNNQTIVIARLSILLLLSSCNNFNVTHYSKILKVSAPDLEYLLIMTRCTCKARGITLKATIFLVPLIDLHSLMTLKFKFQIQIDLFCYFLYNIAIFQCIVLILAYNNA